MSTKRQNVQFCPIEKNAGQLDIFHIVHVVYEVLDLFSAAK
jgi:hypothetical protein